LIFNGKSSEWKDYFYNKEILTFDWSEEGTCKIGNELVLLSLGNELATSVSSSLDDIDVVILSKENI
jgi:hypothetical protein